VYSKGVQQSQQWRYLQVIGVRSERVVYCIGAAFANWGLVYELIQIAPLQVAD
jgi:hypothetical protein